MSVKRSVFQGAAEAVLAKYANTPLADRWQEAVSFGKGVHASVYWIRDSADVTNIVWLDSGAIKDITLFKDAGQAAFNFVPLRNVVGVETREGGADLARGYGYDVKGNMIARVFCATRNADLAWIPETDQQKAELKTFLKEVLKQVLKGYSVAEQK